MGWHIFLMENTVKVSRECAQEVRMFADDGSPTELENIWDERTGFLRFNPDWLEWQDWLQHGRNKEALAVLKRYKVNGAVAFSDPDQGMVYPDGVLTWRYVFTNGELSYSSKTIKPSDIKPKRG